MLIDQRHAVAAWVYQQLSKPLAPELLFRFSTLWHNMIKEAAKLEEKRRKLTEAQRKCDEARSRHTGFFQMTCTDARITSLSSDLSRVVHVAFTFQSSS